MELRPITPLRRSRILVLALALVAPLGAAADTLQVVTYNIHSGLGPAFRFRQPKAVVEENLRAVARAIAAVPAQGEPIDLVALNEVDFGSRRSGWIDEAAFLAEELRRTTGERYEVVRGETWRRRVPGFEVSFGNAALVRGRVLRAASCLLADRAPCAAAGEAASLPSLDASRGWGRFLREQRGVISLTLDVGGRPLDVLVTHLEAFAQEDREAQATHLLARFVDAERTTVLLGDMNAVPPPLVRPLFGNDRTASILSGGALADARALYATRRADASPPETWATFPSDHPRWPIDWVLGSADLVPEVVKTVGERESDHRGLFVKFLWHRPPST